MDLSLTYFETHIDLDKGPYIIDENESKVYQRSNLIEFRKLRAQNYYRGHHMLCNFQSGQLETCPNCRSWLNDLGTWSDVEDPNPVFQYADKMILDAKFELDLKNPTVSILILRDWVYETIKPYINKKLEHIELELTEEVSKTILKWKIINTI